MTTDTMPPGTSSGMMIAEIISGTGVADNSENIFVLTICSQERGSAPKALPRFA
jgi:hypothetical protein